MLEDLDLTRLHELEENGVQTQASLGRKLGDLRRPYVAECIVS